MKLKMLVFISLFTVACSKRSDTPPAPPSNPPENGSPNPCQRAISSWSNTLFVDKLEKRTVAIPYFDMECGDFVNVYSSPSGANNWFQISTVQGKPSVSYYSISLNNITINNGASVGQDFRIDAVLK